MRQTLPHVLTLSLTLFFIPFFAFAQEGFIALSQIPGVTDKADLGSFLNAAFKLGLGIAGTLAVVMITIGGIEYMGRESVFEKTAGKERMTNAVIGLLLALLIWVILYTINPNLTNFNIKPTQREENNEQFGGAKRNNKLEQSSDEPEQKGKKGGAGIGPFTWDEPIHTP